MIRSLGLDISNVTGWCILDDDRLVDKGSIHLMSQMELPQKLHYFSVELQTIIDRFHPDWAFIEDVFLGISGVKILSYLARLNGVAISICFSVLQDRVKLYEPNYWKSHSFEGLLGTAKKWQIQLAVLKYYNLIDASQYDISQDLIQSEISQNDLIEQSKQNSLLLEDLRKSINRKRNPLSEEEKEQAQIELDRSLIVKTKLKQDLKKLIFSYDKKITKGMLNLTSRTGITDNIADSIGIALCGYKEVSNG